MTEDNSYKDMGIIFKYTREEAIADGVLVDVTEQAEKVGFKLHTVITDTIHAELEVNAVEVSAATEYNETEIYNTILISLLHQAAEQAKAAKEAKRRLPFTATYKCVSADLEYVYNFHLHLGPGDEGEPVLTIMRPDED